MRRMPPRLPMPLLAAPSAPADVRTDLSGAEIAWMGPSAADPDLAWNQAALAKFTEATGIKVNLINGENQTDARLQAMRQQFAGAASDTT